MDIAIINSDTGEIENVICCASVQLAEQFYPNKLCIERRVGEEMEPGGRWDNGTIIRADLLMMLLPRAS